MASQKILGDISLMLAKTGASILIEQPSISHENTGDQLIFDKR